jgi:outer membrane protein assembly factor BamB
MVKITNSIAFQGYHSSACLGSDGTIYFASIGLGLFALTPLGEVKWMFPFSGVLSGSVQVSSPAIAPAGTIYVGSTDHNVYALSPQGNLLWKFMAGDSISSSPSIAEDGTILVGSDDGKLYALSPTGEKKWEFNAGSIIESSAAIGSDGNVYVGSLLNQSLFALTSSGQPTWTNKISGGVSASPMIGTDGQVWAGGLNGVMNIFNADGTKGTNYSTQGGVLFSSPVTASFPEPCAFFASGNALYRRSIATPASSNGWPMFRRNPNHFARADQCGLTIQGVAGAMVQIALTVETNRTYSLESSEDLSTWSPTQAIQPSERNFQLKVPQVSDRSFYRLSFVP